jgi:2-methylcitrate dehydratase PrpD
MPLARQIAEFAVETARSGAPEGVLDTVRSAVLDTTGVAIAGYAERCAVAARSVAAGREGSAATVWGGGGLRAAAADAAWMNAAAAHALDFDDYNLESFGHSSTVLVPAVLAVAEQHGLPGSRAAAGYAVGYEVMAAIGNHAGHDHYERGFHATGTIGTLGAAAASAAVLGLDVRQTTMALAISASMAAGLRCNFGTDTKPLHAAQAAANGIRAAFLAAEGFTGSEDALDAPNGFIAALGADVTPVADDCAKLGSRWFLEDSPPVVKLYPSCGMTHSAIAAALTLRADTPDLVRRAERIVVRVPPQSAWPLKYHRAGTGLEGKFCLEYAVSTALLNGMPRIEHFTDEAVREPAVRQLAERVTLQNDAGYEAIVDRNQGLPMSVEVHADGETASSEVLDAPGSPRNPASRKQLEDKFDACVAPVIGTSQAAQARRQLLELASTGAVGGALALLGSAG